MNPYNGFTGEQRLSAYEWGKLQDRPPVVSCMACGQTEGRLERHSEDYSKPYGPHIGRWHLCFRCHRMLHMRFRLPNNFFQYRKLLIDGYSFPALHGTNNVCWKQFCGEMFKLPYDRQLNLVKASPRKDVFADILRDGESAMKIHFPEKSSLQKILFDF